MVISQPQPIGKVKNHGIFQKKIFTTEESTASADQNHCVAKLIFSLSLLRSLDWLPSQAAHNKSNIQSSYISLAPAGDRGAGFGVHRQADS